MNNYLFGTFAVVLAITLSSFTSTTKQTNNVYFFVYTASTYDKSSVEDPCNYELASSEPACNGCVKVCAIVIETNYTLSIGDLLCVDFPDTVITAVAGCAGQAQGYVVTNATSTGFILDYTKSKT